MASRIKSRVKTSTKPRGFKSKMYADQGKHKGEQGKPRHPGYSGGRRKKATLSSTPKKAYAKRIKN